MAGSLWVGCSVLPMAARQAHGSHLPDLRLFGYFIFANRQRGRNDRAPALVTGIGGEVKVLFSHRFPPQRKIRNGTTLTGRSALKFELLPAACRTPGKIVWIAT